MKRKLMILAFGAMLFVVVGWYGALEYFRPNPDMNTLRAAFQSDAVSLIGEFGTNETAATTKYLGKVLEVSGPVARVENDERGYYTVVLSEAGVMSSLRCAMDKAHLGSVRELKPGSSVVIKGMLTGYNKDITGLLGSDVQLNRCVVVSDK